MPASVDTLFPKCLRDLLITLLEKNELRSWHIHVYSEKTGSCLKIHFKENGSQTETHTGGDSYKIASYSKKSPSRLRRDNDRYTSRMKTRSQSKKAQNSNENDLTFCSKTSELKQHIFLVFYSFYYISIWWLRIPVLFPQQKSSQSLTFWAVKSSGVSVSSITAIFHLIKVNMTTVISFLTIRDW